MRVRVPVRSKYIPAGFVLKVKRASAGLGLFAGEAIADGSCILEYVGPDVPEEKRNTIKSRYLFAVSKTRTIDGSPRYNTARYINHSCRPNAQAVILGPRVFIMAIKAIDPGEEITFDYGKGYFDMFIGPERCRCPVHRPE